MSNIIKHIPIYPEIMKNQRPGHLFIPSIQHLPQTKPQKHEKHPKTIRTRSVEVCRAGPKSLSWAPWAGFSKLIRGLLVVRVQFRVITWIGSELLHPQSFQEVFNHKDESAEGKEKKLGKNHSNSAPTKTTTSLRLPIDGWVNRARERFDRARACVWLLVSQMVLLSAFYCHA